MSKTTIFRVDIQFGDCDPAGIVFFPNFSKWMDAAALHFFVACGVPPWRELTKTTGLVGMPLLEIHTKFLKSATYGESLEIRTDIEEWREKVFVQRHVARRGDDVICEGRETRVFCVKDPANPDRLKSIPVPDFIRKLCD